MVSRHPNRNSLHSGSRSGRRSTTGHGRASAFSLTLLVATLLVLTSACARGRTLPSDSALGLVDLPTATPTPPKPIVPTMEALPDTPTPTPTTVLLYVLPTLPPPSVTSTSTPAPEPSATATERPVPTSTPTERAAATATHSPTPRSSTIAMTATATKVPTATQRPAAATPTTVVTAGTISVERTWTTPNCGLTEIRGQIRDLSGRGISGQVVRVTSLSAPSKAPMSSLPSSSSGAFNVTLSSKPEAGRWQVQVLAPGGQSAGPATVVETSSSDCSAAGSGAQSVYIEYRSSQ